MDPKSWFSLVLLGEITDADGGSGENSEPLLPSQNAGWASLLLGKKLRQMILFPVEPYDLPGWEETRII